MKGDLVLITLLAISLIAVWLLFVNEKKDLLGKFFDKKGYVEELDINNISESGGGAGGSSSVLTFNLEDYYLSYQSYFGEGGLIIRNKDGNRIAGSLSDFIGCTFKDYTPWPSCKKPRTHKLEDYRLAQLGSNLVIQETRTGKVLANDFDDFLGCTFKRIR